MKKLLIVVAVVLSILITNASALEPLAVTNKENGQQATPVYPPLPPGSIEIAYDDGIFTYGAGDNGLVVSDTFQVRVRFTPPPETVGGLLKEARIAWLTGLEGNFFVRIKDAVTGSYVDSPPLSNVPSGNWQVVDVSALGFIIPNNDFYIEVQQVTGSPAKAVYMDDSSYSARSEHYGICGTPNYIWCSIGDPQLNYLAELGIRAVVQPQSQYQYCFRMSPYPDEVRFNVQGNNIYGRWVAPGYYDYPMVGVNSQYSIVYSAALTPTTSYMSLVNKGSKAGTFWGTDGSSLYTGPFTWVPCGAPGPEKAQGSIVESIGK